MAMAASAITVEIEAPSLHSPLHNPTGRDWSAPPLSPPSACCSPPLLLAARFSSSQMWELPELDTRVAEHTLLARRA
jgi:hypothetical protein